MNIFEHFGAFWTKKGCKLIKNISKVISRSTPRSQRSIPPLFRSSMCSEWGLLSLARRTYSSKCPLDISRCGLIASSTTAKPCRGPQSSEETQRREVAWRLEALRYSSLGVLCARSGDSSHSRAALTPQNVHWTFLGAA